jgi:Necrosis inducing protein (NPP1)
MRRAHESTSLATLFLGTALAFGTGCLGDETMLDDTDSMAEEDTDTAVQALAAQMPHNRVVPFGDAADPFEVRYQPRLKVNGGCVPFPAVQADGRWSGGLESTGSESGGCSSNRGQVYVRHKEYPGRGCAVMYSWYFPKDGNVFAGHRHDWEGIVVWLHRCSPDAGDPIAVAYSAHGGWYVERGAAVDLHKRDGKIQPKVKYYKATPVTNYEVHPTRDAGGMQPLIDWRYLTAAARDTLNNANFGRATPPFKDSNFNSKVEAARYW